MRPPRPKSDQNCGTSYIFGNTYFFSSKCFFSFFLEIFIGWKFDSLRDRPVSISEKNSAQSVRRKPRSIPEVGGGGALSKVEFWIMVDILTHTLKNERTHKLYFIS